MSRIKGKCEECGKRVTASKLIVLPKSTKKMCLNCRKKELKRRNKAISPIINKITVNSSTNNKKYIRTQLQHNSGLTRDEEIVLKLKYGYDPFKSGKFGCSQIKNLKQKLFTQKLNDKNIKKKKESLISKKNEEKQELNDKFLDGLK